MKIKDLKQKELPFKIKLTEGFKLEESFDPGVILVVHDFGLDPEFPEDNMWWIKVTALGSDKTYNNSVSVPNWYNKRTQEFDQRFFDHHQEQMDSEGNFHDKIYVEADEDFFEFMEPQKTAKQILCEVWNCEEDELQTNLILNSSVSLVVEAMEKYKNQNQ